MDGGKKMISAELTRMASSMDGPSKLVPLPTEIPRPPDFSALPPSILHSGTVETLLGLNEDLMARLKINIRRNSVYEQQILELEKAQNELSFLNQSLTSQLELLAEKGAKNDVLRSKLAAAEEQRDRLKSSARSHLAFRRRVLRWVKPLVKRLKKDLHIQAERNTSLEAKLLNREAQLSDVRARLTDSITHIQNQEKIFVKDQAKIVEHYESKQNLLQKDNERFLNEIKLMRDKASRMDQVVAARAEAENKIIYLQRRADELEARLQREVAEQQNGANAYRLEAKSLALENRDLIARVEELTTQYKNQSTSLERLQDQFESMQTLWADAQKKLEAARHNADKLNMVNQELAKKLKVSTVAEPAGHA